MAKETELVRLLNIEKFKRQLCDPVTTEENRKMIVGLLAEEVAHAPLAKSALFF